MRTPKIVQAPEGCCSYLTAGKNYNTIIVQADDGAFGCLFSIIDDSQEKIITAQKASGHLNGGDWIIVEWNEDEPTQNVNAQDPQDEAERVREAAPEMLKALQSTQRLLSEMRKYLPKSIKNADKFLFENVNAAIGEVIHKATQP